MAERREIEGVLRSMRSESSDCICCDGPHIFSYGLDIEPRPSIFPGLIVGSVSEWISEELSPWRDRDGMKVRVILEFEGEGVRPDRNTSQGEPPDPTKTTAEESSLLA